MKHLSLFITCISMISSIDVRSMDIDHDNKKFVTSAQGLNPQARSFVPQIKNFGTTLSASRATDLDTPKPYKKSALLKEALRFNPHANKSKPSKK